ncbi:hypothetical protein Thiowin_00090 [Thiorhodovibrio winogradskyi]|uniref:Transposase n=1 Tax=Thiorhodovibrio winogradskyi TaxID=77007 RepID=A0ABZ0S4B5_9GAMM
MPLLFLIVFSITRKQCNRNQQLLLIREGFDALIEGCKTGIA